MKLFKKALLATAVFGAMGANAAVLSSDAINLSAEGVKAGLSATDVGFDVDFVVKKLTPSASTITLKFDDAVVLDLLEDAVGTSTVAISNTVGTGQGTVDATTATSSAAVGDTLITFDYGTGSFTFDRFTVDADEGTITFEVNLGNPLTAESAFRMTVATEAGVEFEGAAKVCYSSVDASDVAIENGDCGDLATEKSQFAFAVTKGFDGKVERVTQKSFTRNGDDASNDTVDELTFTVVNNESLEASLDVTDVLVEFAGDFDNGATVAGNKVETADFATTAGTTTVPADLESIDFALGGNTAVTTAAKNTYTITFTGDTGTAIVIPQTGSIEAKATIEADAAGSAITPLVIASDVDAGSWALDATVINIPYFPVGFEGLSTSVHFANESANDADVIVTAIDQTGEEYDGTIADLAGDTVTKVSQADIMKALGAPAGSKLSVTFNIDANEGDVNAYAFSNAGTGRQSLVTSQQKGK